MTRAIRPLVLLSMGMALAVPPWSSVAAQSQGSERRDAPQSAERPVSPEARRAAQLDQLFERLGNSGDAAEAAGIARLIERQWLRSGSDTADLLMSRALVAARSGNPPLAIELLDRVVVIEAGWAEAWAKRATLFGMLGDRRQAILDLQQAIAREPRHYEAWTALGRLFEVDEEKALALRAYRQALAVHPHLEAVKAAVERLAPDVDGRDI
ncbi:hypothetical protein AL346_03300 [Chelatococcus sp. CO-6]|nr:hypothetical protein AL346_03300 [Chelatococcus sp. CO-6]